jgi:hypothetical protein
MLYFALRLLAVVAGVAPEYLFLEIFGITGFTSLRIHPTIKQAAEDLSS